MVAGLQENWRSKTRKIQVMGTSKRDVDILLPPPPPPYGIISRETNAPYINEKCLQFHSVLNKSFEVRILITYRHRLRQYHMSTAMNFSNSSQF
jgi:hypothetical protein